MQPGIIYFDGMSLLADGKRDRRLIVILSDGKQQPYVAVRTTSVIQEGFNTRFGCHVNEKTQNFCLPLHSTYLKDETWIDLNKFYSLNQDQLAAKLESDEIEKVCRLPKKILIKLLPCAISSKSISEQQKQEVWRTLSHIDDHYLES